jgi:hypothetical protein
MHASIGRQLGDSRAYQSWIALEGRNAREDAVYLHTPNPHVPFPARLEHVTWGGVELLPHFAHLPSEANWRVGATPGASEPDDDGHPRTWTSYVVYRRDIGQPLES